MTVQCSVPILKPFACKLCTLWQILHDRALKNVEDFSSLFDLGTLPFGNIAHGKNRSYIKKVSVVSRFVDGNDWTSHLKILSLFLGLNESQDEICSQFVEQGSDPFQDFAEKTKGFGRFVAAMVLLQNYVHICFQIGERRVNGP